MVDWLGYGGDRGPTGTAEEIDRLMVNAGAAVELLNKAVSLDPELVAIDRNGSVIYFVFVNDESYDEPEVELLQRTSKVGGTYTLTGRWLVDQYLNSVSGPWHLIVALSAAVAHLSDQGEKILLPLLQLSEPWELP